jgi:hypothetical protein
VHPDCLPECHELSRTVPPVAHYPLRLNGRARRAAHPDPPRGTPPHAQ